MMLAHRFAKPDGRIAAVLPLALAQAESSHLFRRFLGGNMHVEYVVAIKDPQDVSFSENTGIDEMIVVAVKRNPNPDDTTKFVKMLRKPKTAVQGYSVGEAILRGDDDHGDYEITEWPQSHMAAGDWFPTQFVRPECVEFFQNLKSDKWFPTAHNKYVGNLGPAGRRIRDAFTRVDTTQIRYAIWDHKTDVQTTMAAVPASYSFVRAKSGKESLADKYWERRENVLLPARLAVSFTKATAVYSDKRAVGSAFVPYRPIAGKEHSQERVNKACVAYLNSSVGVAALLAVTSNRMILYPNWSLSNMRRLTFPYWERLSAEQVERLASAYDELADTPLLPLRERLDAAVGAALGIPEDAVELLRVALASEPAVTGRTFTGRAGV